MSNHKYWKDDKFEYKLLKTWKRYPVEVSKRIVGLVLSKTKKHYNPEHVRYLLNLYFSEMAQEFKNSRKDSHWFMDDFGTFKLKVYDKVVQLPNTKMIKYDCKTVRFALAPHYKKITHKILNKDNDAVIEYIREKRKNCRIAKFLFNIRKSKYNEEEAE